MSKKKNKEARVVSIINNKGGVGKTTTTANLGKALSLQGLKVLIIDMDSQANLTESFGLTGSDGFDINDVLSGNKTVAESKRTLSENLDILTSSQELSGTEVQLSKKGLTGYFQLKNALKAYITAYDVMLIDTPPALSTLTVNSMIASSDVLIVIQAEYLSTKGLSTIIDFLNEYSESLDIEINVLGMLLTQVNNTRLKQQISESVAKNYKEYIFSSQIRETINFTESQTMGKDIFTYMPKSKGAEDYTALAKEVILRLKKINL